MSFNYGTSSTAILFDEDDAIMIGKPAPEFELPNLNGEQITLASYKGQIVVIHIATT